MEYHKEVGWVESGFYDIYENMNLRTLDGKTTKIAEGLTKIVNEKNAHLTITGHSLGQLLSSYIMLDVSKKCKRQKNVDMCLFASPKSEMNNFQRTFRK